MGLYAISDLHLGFAIGKTMDCFGGQWVGHTKKIEHNWRETVKEEDTILLPGDLSWAGNLADATTDLKWIQSMPGKKVLMAGNHDYWWHSTSRLKESFPDMVFLRHDFFAYGEIAVCGSRGWLCPNDTYYTQEDEKIYQREQIRLKKSIETAIKSGFSEIYLMMHFPPTNDKKEWSGFLDIISAYPQITKIIYGHLHGEDSFGTSYEGLIDGREYYLVSGDYLKFWPLRIC